MSESCIVTVAQNGCLGKVGEGLGLRESNAHEGCSFVCNVQILYVDIILLQKFNSKFANDFHEGAY
jgi:hypothetical protein